jgi:MerR family transcriptional regulator, light-induced transcriptional regulator
MVEQAAWSHHTDVARNMNQDFLTERFFEALIHGNRTQAATIALEAEANFGGTEGVVSDLFWPMYEQLDKLYRGDQLSTLAYQFATRLLRSLTDQFADRLPRTARPATSVSVFCGTTLGEELGAQMAVDLLHAAGCNVRFGGGGVASDEILAHVHETRPEILVLFAASASDLPGIRMLVDTLKEIGACPNTRLIVGGGVFNRAPGLADEMGAETHVGSPRELAEAVLEERRAIPLGQGVAQQIERKPAARRRAAA